MNGLVLLGALAVIIVTVAIIDRMKSSLASESRDDELGHSAGGAAQGGDLELQDPPEDALGEAAPASDYPLDEDASETGDVAEEDESGDVPQHGSWRCKRCGETSEAAFDTCWNCGEERKTAGEKVEEEGPRRWASSTTPRRPSFTPQRATGDANSNPRPASNWGERRYRYLVVPFSGSPEEESSEQETPERLSRRLEEVINQHARIGWEYCRVERIEVGESVEGFDREYRPGKPGAARQQVVFRRPLE